MTSRALSSFVLVSIFAAACAAPTEPSVTSEDQELNQLTGPLDIVTYDVRLELGANKPTDSRPEECTVALRFETRDQEKIQGPTIKLTEFDGNVVGAFEMRRYQRLARMDYVFSCARETPRVDLAIVEFANDTVRPDMGAALQPVAFQPTTENTLGRPGISFEVGAKGSRPDPELRRVSCETGKELTFVRARTDLTAPWAKKGDDYEATLRLDGNAASFRYRPKYGQVTGASFVYCRAPGDVVVSMDLVEKDLFKDDRFVSDGNVTIASGDYAEIEHYQSNVFGGRLSLTPTFVTVQR